VSMSSGTSTSPRMRARKKIRVHYTYILVLNSLNFDSCTRSFATVLMLCCGEFWMVNLKNPYNLAASTSECPTQSAQVMF